MNPKIVHLKVKEAVQETVGRAMELADYRKHVSGSVFLKVNLLSDQVVPGQCTSPWVLEGVLMKLRRDGFSEIYVGDANVATSRQVARAAKKWGHLELCRKYGAKFVNLSKTRKVMVNSAVFGKVGIPEILTKVNSVITIPVLKTHNVAGFTCCLKNQWGCLPEVRHRYHLMLDRCIPEINRIIKPCFGVVDATICSEGSGPRTGEPKIVNSILAGSDLVALDSCCAEMIGAEKTGYLRKAGEKGLGKLEYEIVGDKVDYVKFKPGIARNHPIVFMEMILRKIPVINWILFKTPLFIIPAFLASKYNSFVWHNLKGKRYARQILKKNKLYMEEFRRLIE
jgi:uncharacterized protein (DUF362 family)